MKDNFHTQPEERCPFDGSAGFHDWVDGECAQCGTAKLEEQRMTNKPTLTHGYAPSEKDRDLAELLIARIEDARARGVISPQVFAQYAAQAFMCARHSDIESTEEPG